MSRNGLSGCAWNVLTVKPWCFSLVKISCLILLLATVPVSREPGRLLIVALSDHSCSEAVPS